MKKALVPTILFLVFLTQTSPSYGETQSFQLSVTIPAMIQMTADICPPQDQQLAAVIDPRAAQMVQEQMIVRNGETVLVRSIVAL